MTICHPQTPGSSGPTPRMPDCPRKDGRGGYLQGKVVSQRQGPATGTQPLPNLLKASGLLPWALKSALSPDFWWCPVLSPKPTSAQMQCLCRPPMQGQGPQLPCFSWVGLRRVAWSPQKWPPHLGFFTLLHSDRALAKSPRSHLPACHSSAPLLALPSLGSLLALHHGPIYLQQPAQVQPPLLLRENASSHVGIYPTF